MTKTVYVLQRLEDLEDSDGTYSQLIGVWTTVEGAQRAALSDRRLALHQHLGVSLSDTPMPPIPWTLAQDGSLRGETQCAALSENDITISWLISPCALDANLSLNAAEVRPGERHEKGQPNRSKEENTLAAWTKIIVKD